MRMWWRRLVRRARWTLRAERWDDPLWMTGWELHQKRMEDSLK